MTEPKKTVRRRRRRGPVRMPPEPFPMPPPPPFNPTVLGVTVRVAVDSVTPEALVALFDTIGKVVPDVIAKKADATAKLDDEWQKWQKSVIDQQDSMMKLYEIMKKEVSRIHENLSVVSEFVEFEKKNQVPPKPDGPCFAAWHNDPAVHDPVPIRVVGKTKDGKYKIQILRSDKKGTFAFLDKSVVILDNSTDEMSIPFVDDVVDCNLHEPYLLPRLSSPS